MRKGLHAPPTLFAQNLMLMSVRSYAASFRLRRSLAFLSSLKAALVMTRRPSTNGMKKMVDRLHSRKYKRGI